MGTRARRGWALAWALLGALICALFAIWAWMDAHVTYALPSGSHGHDIVPGGIGVSVIGVVATLTTISTGYLTWRQRVSPLASTLITAAALIATIVAPLIFTNSSTPTY